MVAVAHRGQRHEEGGWQVSTGGQHEEGRQHIPKSSLSSDFCSRVAPSRVVPSRVTPSRVVLSQVTDPYFRGLYRDRAGSYARRL